eukprot:TRINITY_DN2920_c0_g2_i4.p1 TRINITY_DN2920_c0_g2~~TRINITY_DN2920_c0_g2_i4.p1  ORF type:complete len:421 (+),score=21.89 TRINITY_DN2920_c0_g2_i4:384-1646(+)
MIRSRGLRQTYQEFSLQYASRSLQRRGIWIKGRHMGTGMRILRAHHAQATIRGRTHCKFTPYYCYEEEIDPLPAHIDHDVKTLVHILLDKNPCNRPNIVEIANLSWMKANIIKFAQSQNCFEELQSLINVEPLSIERSFGDRLEERKQSDEVKIPFTLEKIGEIARAIHQSIHLHTEEQEIFKEIENVVTGEDLSQWLRTRYAASDAAIKEFCQEMIDRSFIHSVNEFEEFNRTPNALYRFHVDKPRFAINMFKIWNGPIKSAISVARDLVSKMNELIKEIKVEMNEDFFYSIEKIKASEALARFEDTTCELQKCEILTLPRNVKIAFFLNIYQVMYTHQIIRELQSSKDQKVLISTISDQIGFQKSRDFFYCIHSITFTVEEIKHGVLRNNKKFPNSLFRSFGASDFRNTLLQVTCAFV